MSDDGGFAMAPTPYFDDLAEDLAGQWADSAKQKAQIVAELCDAFRRGHRAGAEWMHRKATRSIAEAIGTQHDGWQVVDDIRFAVSVLTAEEETP